MAGYPPMPLRIWRTMPWCRSALMRSSDRVEAMIRIVAAVVILAAVPVAGAVGTAYYSYSIVQIRAENAAKVDVSATIVDNPLQVTAPTPAGVANGRFEAKVQWSHVGHSGAATIDVGGTAKLGDRISLWLGPNGQPTTAPPPTEAAATRGIGAGFATLVGIWGGVVGVIWLTAWVIDRCHRIGWAREWRLISGPIGQDKQ